MIPTFKTNPHRIRDEHELEVTQIETLAMQAVASLPYDPEDDYSQRDKLRDQIANGQDIDREEDGDE